MANDHFVSVLCVECTYNVYARGCGMEWIRRRQEDAPRFSSKRDSALNILYLHAVQIRYSTHGCNHDVALARLAKHVSCQHHCIISIQYGGLKSVIFCCRV